MECNVTCRWLWCHLRTLACGGLPFPGHRPQSASVLTRADVLNFGSRRSGSAVHGHRAGEPLLRVGECVVDVLVHPLVQGGHLSRTRRLLGVQPERLIEIADQAE